MALKISRAAKTGAAPIAGQAGTKMVAVFEYTFAEAFAATDVLELGFIPANAKVIGATLIKTAFGLSGTVAITADVGILNGGLAENDDTRALQDTALFNDASLETAGEVAATTAASLAIAKDQKHRGIGVDISHDVTADPNKKLTLVLEYAY